MNAIVYKTNIAIRKLSFCIAILLSPRRYGRDSNPRPPA